MPRKELLVCGFRYARVLRSLKARKAAAQLYAGGQRLHTCE